MRAVVNGACAKGSFERIGRYAKEILVAIGCWVTPDIEIMFDWICLMRWA